MTIYLSHTIKTVTIIYIKLSQVFLTLILKSSNLHSHFNCNLFSKNIIHINLINSLCNQSITLISAMMLICTLQHTMQISIAVNIRKSVKIRSTKMTMQIKHLASKLIHVRHAKRAFLWLVSSNDISMILTILSFTMLLLSSTSLCRSMLTNWMQNFVQFVWTSVSFTLSLTAVSLLIIYI